MGTDIHIAVEVRERGLWATATEWATEDFGDSEYRSPKHEVYEGRNYSLFAILADVRNGSGFAGVKTGEGFSVISPPRGVPDDAAPETRVWMESGNHTPSWLTVAEIMAFDWTQVTTLCGVVSLSEWARWKQYGEPHSYAGGVSGPNILHVDEAVVSAAWERSTEFVSRIDIWEVVRNQKNAVGRLAGLIAPQPGPDVYTRVSWDKPYFACCRDFLAGTLPQLWRLGKPEDVRICFWFDS